MGNFKTEFLELFSEKKDYYDNFEDKIDFNFIQKRRQLKEDKFTLKISKYLRFGYLNLF